MSTEAFVLQLLAEDFQADLLESADNTLRRAYRVFSKFPFKPLADAIEARGADVPDLMLALEVEVRRVHGH